MTIYTPKRRKSSIKNRSKIPAKYAYFAGGEFWSAEELRSYLKELRTNCLPDVAWELEHSIIPTENYLAHLRSNCLPDVAAAIEDSLCHS